MEEIRKDDIVEMYFSGNKTLRATIIDFTKNRISIQIPDEFIDTVKMIKPLDDLVIVAYTDFGIKKTYSSVIEIAEDYQTIVVENNPSIPVVQKREFVRILSDVSFIVRKGNEAVECTCVNISGGGIAFKSDKFEIFQPNDRVKIIFHSVDFEKDIYADAIILSVEKNKITARYSNLNQHDEAKIVKYVFKKSARRIL